MFGSLIVKVCASKDFRVSTFCEIDYEKNCGGKELEKLNYGRERSGSSRFIRNEKII